MGIIDKARSFFGPSSYEDDIEREIHDRAKAIYEASIASVISERGDTRQLPDIVSRKLVEIRSRRSVVSNAFVKDKASLYVSSNRVKAATTITSPYDYGRIDSFHSKESYFSRSVTRQLETLLRNGFTFVSDDKQALALLNKELNLIQMASLLPLNQIYATIIKNLAKYGMVFVEKVRGKATQENIGSIKFLNVLRPHRMQVYLDDNGMILGVNDVPTGPPLAIRSFFGKRVLAQFPRVKVKDLCFGSIDNNIFPEPPPSQSLDDILSLRSVEETIELMCAQYGSPLLHNKVGTTEEPADINEVLSVHNRIVDMATNGFVSTDHRVTLVAVPLQDASMDLMPVVNHFKGRVLVGTGSSNISLGEGDTANRNTAESIDDALEDRCAFFAGIVCDIFNKNIIPDILMSTGKYNFSSIFNAEGEPIVQLHHEEMRIEKKVTKSNHVVSLWETNLITRETALKSLRLPPITGGEEKDTFLHLVQIPRKELGISQGTNTGASNARKSQLSPSNQYGTKPGPGSRKN